MVKRVKVRNPINVKQELVNSIMDVDINNLKIGSVYEIDTRSISRSANPGIDARDRFPLRDNNIRFIRIVSKPSQTFYKIRPLNDDMTERRLGSFQVGNRPPIAKGTTLTIEFPLPILREIVSPAEAIRDTISSKAKYQAIKEVLGKQGLPDTMDSGIGTFLPPNVKPPPKQSGVGRRKTKKAKRKTRSRK